MILRRQSESPKGKQHLKSRENCRMLLHNECFFERIAPARFCQPFCSIVSGNAVFSCQPTFGLGLAAIAAL